MLWCGQYGGLPSPSEQGMLGQEEQWQSRAMSLTTSFPWPKSPSPLLGHWQGTGLWRDCPMRMLSTTLAPEG